MLGLTKTCPIDVNQSLDEGPRLLQADSPEVDHDQLIDLDCLPEPLGHIPLGLLVGTSKVSDI